MDILYKNEHQLCKSYDKREKPAIEKIFLVENQEINELPAMHEIIFIQQGGLTYWRGKKEEIQVRVGELVFLPSEHRIKMLARVETELIIIRMYDRISFCDHYLLENLLHQTYNSDNGILKNDSSLHLRANEILVMIVECAVVITSPIRPKSYCNSYVLFIPKRS